MHLINCRAWIASLLFIFILFMPTPLSAENQPAKVRVGIIAFSGFYNIDENGNLSGYGYDYLQEIAKYTGWQYEYIYTSWSNCLTLLQKKEIDLVGLSTYDANRALYFDYGTIPSGIIGAALYIKSSNTQITYENFHQFNQLRVGLLQENIYNKYFQEFCSLHQITTNNTTYSTTPELLEALENNEVDAIVSVDTLNMNNVKIIAPLTQQYYYFMTSKGNKPILNGLESAQSKINRDSPYFESILHEKYFNTVAAAFTQEELNYINEHAEQPLSVGYDPNWAPIEYYDEKTNVIAGFSPDLFAAISEYSGLQFTFIKPDSFSAALTMLNNNEINLLSAIDYAPNFATTAIRLSDSYLTIPSVIIKNKLPKERDQPILILPKNYASCEKFKNYMTKDTIIHYADTVEACFDAIATGKADITYSNSYITNILLQKYKYRNLTSSLVQYYSDKLHIALSAKADPILLSILNKSLRTITKDKMDTIIVNNLVKQSGDNSFVTIFYRNTTEIIIIGICIIALMICISAYIIIMKNRYNATIEKLAFVDELTGMWNYNKFKKEAALLLRRAPQNSYAILFMDISKFKYINNSFGFDVGNHVLKHVATTLAENINIGNIFSRVSADQFVLMLQYTNTKDIIIELRKLYQKIQLFQRTATDSYTLSFSCGIALITPATLIENLAFDINTAIDQAIMAQRTVKTVHGNSYAFYNDAFREQIIKEKKIEDIMEQSLLNHEFVVYYQPQYTICDSKISGAEALVRWKSPKYGMIYPNDFIPLFEKNGFITSLDFYVINSVCQSMKEWMQAGKKILPISINISRIHINNPNFSQQLQSIVDQYGISHKLIEVEITESAFIENATNLQKLIIELKRLDFIVSMDDFGSGYSSLNLLKELPFDILKIDKDFFQNGYSTTREQIIITSIVEMSQKLNIKVVAEGVETAEQIAFLKAIKCDVAQGYLFSKPIELVEFLKKF